VPHNHVTTRSLLLFKIASSTLPSFPSSTSNTSRETRTINTDTARLERGGSVAPSPRQLPNIEEFELVDYAGIKHLRREEARTSRRTSKREEKIRRLNEEDEMKFSHSIQFNAVPDWSSHYIAYSNLKKL